MLLSTSVKEIYVYFNNDHDMLENAKRLRNIMIKNKEGLEKYL